VRTDLDALLTALYVWLDDSLPERTGPGDRPKLTDAELIAVAVAQVLLDIPNDRKFLAFARWRLGHLFPYLPRQPGYNKRVRKAAPQILAAVNAIAFNSNAYCDAVWLLDSTPVACGQSRETTRRSALAGHAAYGFCRSHSRYFWGFRLFLLCSPDGMPIGFELAPANVPERKAAAEILERVSVAGRVVLADKGFAGQAFEQLVADYGGLLVRPDRKDEAPRFGSLGGIRQWIESVFQTLKEQLSLERHRARTLTGIVARVAQRLLALAAGLWHNEQIGNPGRHLTAYGH
jgi:Transposase DDE domain